MAEGKTEEAEKARCCFMLTAADQCPDAAVWELSPTTGDPYKTTLACSAHVGALLEDGQSYVVQPFGARSVETPGWEPLLLSAGDVEFNALARRYDVPHDLPAAFKVPATCIGLGSEAAHYAGDSPRYEWPAESPGLTQEGITSRAERLCRHLQPTPQRPTPEDALLEMVGNPWRFSCTRDEGVKLEIAGVPVDLGLVSSLTFDSQRSSNIPLDGLPYAGVFRHLLGFDPFLSADTAELRFPDGRRVRVTNIGPAEPSDEA